MTDAELLQTYYRSFIRGSHILHFHQVLDAYGHLSFRHPTDPSLFVMARSVAPALIATEKDLITFRVRDGEPIDPDSPKAYIERYIHSEIYRRFPDVQAAVHSHAESVIPFTISDVPLKPCYHMAGFLASSGVPVHDSADDVVAPSDIPDLLVRNTTMGEALAKRFDGGNKVTLMRGHGYTVAATSIELAVFYALYTQKNAAIQTAAMGLRAAAGGSMQGLRLLSVDEARERTAFAPTTAKRAWELWVAEVSGCPLYKLGV
jgi:ribulose-5-phosphate 4-epimerase/fuculose-1-phosphate aldolase